MGLDEESGRWQIKLGSDTKKIKANNLVLVEGIPVSESVQAAGKFLQDLLATGGIDAMLQAFASRRNEANWALLETISANLAGAVAKGYDVKQQVLSRLLGVVRDALADRRPKPTSRTLPPPPLDVSSAYADARHGCRVDERNCALCAAAAALDIDGFVVCDGFVFPDEVDQLAAELGAYDAQFETAKIWVGKQGKRAQLSVPSVRSDRVFWVCGDHKTPSKKLLWDSAGVQPAHGLAPCRPHVVCSESVKQFPNLAEFMRRVDDWVLCGLKPKCTRLSGLVERSDAMVSIYDKGAHFQKHVDNPNRDGRVLTSIVYLNAGAPWGPNDGGELQLFPLDGSPPAFFAPLCGRLVLFWADRLAHEVLPAKRRRMALTYWWFDETERRAKVKADVQASAVSGGLHQNDEETAQEFIAWMLSDESTATEVSQRARILPTEALAAVATVVGAKDNVEALEGLDRLSDADLDRLRGSLGKMGLD